MKYHTSIMKNVFSASRPYVSRVGPTTDYTHRFWVGPKSYKITAGCRRFKSLTVARAHWNKRFRVWAIYRNQNDHLNRWSLQFVDRCEAWLKKNRPGLLRRKTKPKTKVRRKK